MRRIQRLFWRPDRVEHILERHEVTPEEVEEALFGDSRGHLLKVGPAERDPEETVYPTWDVQRQDVTCSWL